MNIGLINFNKKGIYEINVPPVPPIGLEYLVDDLKEDNHKISLLDLCFVDQLNTKEMIEYFVSNKDIIGITFRNLGVENYWYWMIDNSQFFVPDIVEIVAIIKKIKNIPVVLGGEAFSIYPDEILSLTGADYGIYGPGEISFKKLVANWVNYKKGTILRGPANLDILHKRELINYEMYLTNRGSAAIQTKVGCPFSCSFCVEAEKTLQIRNIGVVIEELKILLSKNMRFIFVADAEFNNNIPQAITFCDKILQHNLKFKWTTYLNPIPMTEELVLKMKLSGLNNPCISVNSGDNFMQKQFNTNFTIDKVRQVADWFKKYDLSYTVDLIFGGPNETLKSAYQTIDFMEEIKPSVVGMNIGVRLYSNTGLGKSILNKKLETEGKIFGILDNNDNFLLPIFYISDTRIRDFLIEVCQSDPKYNLLGYNDFGGINYNIVQKDNN